ncbi:helix-turn-helix domain-containing protein [uncultured Megasphaera sp.]|uniref:helix-turn-helix domain-containing protein n=1 Tax=uncultured Megasphaera sp. TaxID=165188 RepID=UPI0025971AA1|nr:helix-turn-helix domain-containing protein [uncultured Megasphaera sp.]
MNVLYEVLTLKEAAELWHVSVDTLKQKCIGRVKGDLAFTKEECRQSGKTWLVTRKSMVRLYGENPRQNAK